MIAKGQPPSTTWGEIVLWWQSPIIGWDGITWGAAALVAIVLGLMIVAVVKR